MSGFSSTNPAKMSSFERQLWSAADSKFRTAVIKSKIAKTRKRNYFQIFEFVVLK